MDQLAPPVINTAKHSFVVVLGCTMIPIVILAAWALQACALSPKFLACQLQKPAGRSPLAGCPAETLFVSPDDRNAHFSSLQKAVESL